VESDLVEYCFARSRAEAQDDELIVSAQLPLYEALIKKGETERAVSYLLDAWPRRPRLGEAATGTEVFLARYAEQCGQQEVVRTWATEIESTHVLTDFLAESSLGRDSSFLEYVRSRLDEESDPQFEQRIDLMEAQLAIGLSKEAEDTFQTGLKRTEGVRSPDPFRALFYQARGYAMLGEETRAREFLDRARVQAGESVADYVGSEQLCRVAVEYHKAGHLEEALDSLRQAEQGHETAGDVLQSKLAQAYAKIGDLESAVKWASASPSGHYAVYHLAPLMTSSEQLSSLESLIKERFSTASWAALIEAYVRLGEIEKARQLAADWFGQNPQTETWEYACITKALAPHTEIDERLREALKVDEIGIGGSK
jgi:tetratricopeptide (TPR) repeat protein